MLFFYIFWIVTSHMIMIVPLLALLRSLNNTFTFYMFCIRRSRMVGLSYTMSDIPLLVEEDLG